MKRHLLSLDIGTQSIRAAVLTEDFEIRGVEQIQHEIDSPHPAWAQQNPATWWDGACQATRRVLQNTAIAPGSLTAVATCGQMHGPVGIDEAGGITTPWVQLWCDKRCQAQCEQLRKHEERNQLQVRSANPINPAWIAIKVLWHKENQPDLYARTKCYLAPKDFINYRLTGVMATDPSEASGSFIWDHAADGYSAEMAVLVGVDLQKFAPAHPSHHVVGGVTEGAARLTGIPAGTPVVAGGGDFPVSMLGFGIVGDGMAADVTGTSSLFATHNPRPLIHTAIQNLRHVVDGWIPFTILDCGGLAMKWCRDLFNSVGNQSASFETLIEMAASLPAGAEGLLFYPYLLGERRRENVQAKGGYWGITLNHTAAHFVRATMEGVALALGRDVRLFGRLSVPIERILCVGGGTRNKLWNQIKANVLQKPLEISNEPEAGLKGSALLAAAGAGLIKDPAETACERRCFGRPLSPEVGSMAVYQARLGEFERLYEHMLGYWAGSASL